jgi:integrase
VEAVLGNTLAEITHNKHLKRADEAPLLSVAIENTYQAKWKRNKDGERQLTRSTLILGIIGDLPLDEVDQTAYRKLVKALEASGSADGTINRYLACLKTILKRHKADYSFMEMFDEPDGRIYVLTSKEEQDILRALRDKALRRWPKRQAYLDEFADMVVVLLDTGMRVGELLRLAARDINLNSNLVTIWINKADKPRSVPMTDRCRAILEPRMERARLFDCNQNQVGQAWNFVRAATGIQDADYVPHACRHTCATRLLEAGIDVYTVKEWLGHKTIQTTLRYVHLMPGRLAHAATALQNFVNKTSTDAVTH